MDLERAYEMAAKLGIEKVDHDHVRRDFRKTGLHLWVDPELPADHSEKAGIILLGPHDRVDIPDSLCDERLRHMGEAYKLMAKDHLEGFIAFVRHVVFEREPSRRAEKLANAKHRMELLLGGPD